MRSKRAWLATMVPAAVYAQDDGRVADVRAALDLVDQSEVQNARPDVDHPGDDVEAEKGGHGDAERRDGPDGAREGEILGLLLLVALDLVVVLVVEVLVLILVVEVLPLLLLPLAFVPLAHGRMVPNACIVRA